MREANWDEIFQRRAVTARNAIDERVKSVVPWEDLLTLRIVTVLFSASSTRSTARLGRRHAVAVPNRLFVADYRLRCSRAYGATAGCCSRSRCSLARRWCTCRFIAILPGHSVYVRTDNCSTACTLVVRGDENGISTDPLPFIVLTLVLIWVGSYFSSWAIFRWKNPWLGLVPGGIAADVEHQLHSRPVQLLASSSSSSPRCCC